MNKVENLEELITAYNLTKTSPSAWELHRLHKLTSLRRYLVYELQDHPQQTVNLRLDSPPQSLEGLIAILEPLVQNKRLERKLEPLSILW